VRTNRNPDSYRDASHEKHLLKLTPNAQRTTQSDTSAYTETATPFFNHQNVKQMKQQQSSKASPIAIMKKQAGVIAAQQETIELQRRQLALQELAFAKLHDFTSQLNQQMQAAKEDAKRIDQQSEG
jgi:hypothetical protein